MKMDPETEFSWVSNHVVTWLREYI